MQCDYFDAGVCRSCTLMGVSYAQQVGDKQADAERLLAPFGAGGAWLDPMTSEPEGFRNKAKMVVGGTVERPTLGILDRARHGVDLRRCGLIDPRITAVFEPIARLIADAGLEPYDVPARRGELKNVLVTVSPTGELMVRFVLRSTSRVAALRSRLPALLEAAPSIRVVSANILPDHKAVLEGDREIPLTGELRLAMPLPGVTLSLGAKSFFQTNTQIAAAMYAQAAAWCAEIAPASAWDLYCGVGGFALALASAARHGDEGGASPESANRSGASSTPATSGTPGASGALRAPARTRVSSDPTGPTVVGVEVSEEAVQAARESAEAAGLPVRFVAADATAWAQEQSEAPDLVVVNPPRRGLGADLAAWLEASGVSDVIYSSCNARSLADDLAAMPSLRIAEARLFDMFPQSTHYETMVRLTRS